MRHPSKKGRVNPIVFIIIIWLGRGRVGLRVTLLDYFITKNTDSHPYVLLNSFIFCPQLYLFDSGYSFVVLGKNFLSGGRGESIIYYKMFFSPNIAYHFFTTIKLIYTLVYQCLNSYFFSIFWNMHLSQMWAIKS